MWLLTITLLLFILTIGIHSECRMEPSAWTLLTFHLDPQVEQTTHTQIVIDQTGIQKLRDLADTQLSIVSIIGPYRSGKSTLLNRLLPPLSPKDVFQVGHSVQPQTEEVTIYPIPSCALEDMKESIKLSLSQSNKDPTELNLLLSVLLGVPSNTTLVLADTPGLFAPNRADLFDAQLLAIVNLMSTVVLYNNPGVIQRSQVEQLAESVEAAFALSLFDASSDPSLVIDRPHAIWCMQNLQVALVDRNNQPLSGKSYVQHLLNEIDATAVNNSYGAKLNHFFASLDAIGLPPPTESTKDLMRINELPIEQLAPEYQTARAQLFSRIVALLRPKQLGSTVLNGATLVELLTQWVNNINVPTEHRQASTSELLTNILQREVTRVMSKYKLEMDAVTLPMSDRELRQAHERIVDNIKRTMRTNDQNSDLSSRFTQAAEEAYSKYMEQNVAAIEKHLRTQSVAAEQNWKQKLSQLKSDKLSAAQIVQAEAVVLEQWHAATQNVRNANPSSVAQFEGSLRNTMKADSQPLLFGAITNEKEALVKHCEDRFNTISLPVGPNAIEQIAKECLEEWMTSQPAFSTLDSDSKSTLSVSFKSAIDMFQEAATKKNFDAAVKRCIQSVRERGAELVRENSNWGSNEQYQSRDAVNTQIAELGKLELCQNIANTSSVQAEQLIVANQLTSSLESRVLITRIFEMIMFVYALIDMFLAKQMISEAMRSSGKNYMLLNGGTAISTRSLSSRSQLFAALGCVLGAPMMILSRIVPDALPGITGFALDAALLFVIVFGVIVVCKVLIRTVKGKKDKYVR